MSLHIHSILYSTALSSHTFIVDTRFTGSIGEQHGSAPANHAPVKFPAQELYQYGKHRQISRSSLRPGANLNRTFDTHSWCTRTNLCFAKAWLLTAWNDRSDEIYQKVSNIGIIRVLNEQDHGRPRENEFAMLPCGSVRRLKSTQLSTDRHSIWKNHFARCVVDTCLPSNEDRDASDYS